MMALLKWCNIRRQQLLLPLCCFYHLHVVFRGVWKYSWCMSRFRWQMMHSDGFLRRRSSGDGHKETEEMDSGETPKMSLWCLAKHVGCWINNNWCCIHIQNNVQNCSRCKRSEHDSVSFWCITYVFLCWPSNTIIIFFLALNSPQIIKIHDSRKFGHCVKLRTECDGLIANRWWYHVWVWEASSGWAEVHHFVKHMIV